MPTRCADQNPRHVPPSVKDRPAEIRSGEQPQLDRPCLAITLKRADRAVGEQQLVALSLRDHDFHFVDEEVAGFSEIVDFARPVEEVHGDLDRVFE
jgi:hypothetical protein